MASTRQQELLKKIEEAKQKQSTFGSVGTAVGTGAGALIGGLIGAPLAGVGAIPAATLGASLGGTLGGVGAGMIGGNIGAAEQTAAEEELMKLQQAEQDKLNAEAKKIQDAQIKQEAFSRLLGKYSSF